MKATTIPKLLHAALYAAQIVGIYDGQVREQFRAYRKGLGDEVKRKNARLAELGPKEYVNQSKK